MAQMTKLHGGEKSNLRPCVQPFVRVRPGILRLESWTNRLIASAVQRVAFRCVIATAKRVCNAQLRMMEILMSMSLKVSKQCALSDKNTSEKSTKI